MAQNNGQNMKASLRFESTRYTNVQRRSCLLASVHSFHSWSKRKIWNPHLAQLSSIYDNWPQSVTLMSAMGIPDLVPLVLMNRTTSIPFLTLPKTTCRSFRKSTWCASPTQMKNCDLFVWGPLFDIDRLPSWWTFSSFSVEESKSTSSAKVLVDLLLWKL